MSILVFQMKCADRRVRAILQSCFFASYEKQGQSMHPSGALSQMLLCKYHRCCISRPSLLHVNCISCRLQLLSTILIFATTYKKPSGRTDMTKLIGTFRLSIVAVKKQWVLNVMSVCLCCCLRYPACNAHAPCRYLWPARLHRIFHYLINGSIFGKRLLKVEFLFLFYL